MFYIRNANALLIGPIREKKTTTMTTRTSTTNYWLNCVLIACLYLISFHLHFVHYFSHIFASHELNIHQFFVTKVRNVHYDLLKINQICSFFLIWPNQTQRLRVSVRYCSVACTYSYTYIYRNHVLCIKYVYSRPIRSIYINQQVVCL